MKLDYWEHVRPEILKQGRVSYFDGNILKDEEEDDKSEISSIEENETQATSNEVPIPLFASCSGDRLIDEETFPWKIRLSDVDEKLVLVQSHAWPGSFAFSKDMICDNIYIGYGLKYSLRNYAPPAMPQVAMEFPFGAEITECNDPTVEKEEIFAKKSEVDDEVSADDDDEMDEKQ